MRNTQPKTAIFVSPIQKGTDERMHYNDERTRYNDEWTRYNSDGRSTDVSPEVSSIVFVE